MSAPTPPPSWQPKPSFWAGKITKRRVAWGVVILVLLIGLALYERA
jgi:hypothetical protein